MNRTSYFDARPFMCTVILLIFAGLANLWAQPVQDQLAEAYAALKMEALDQAAGMFEAILKEDPASKEARFGLGTVYTKQERVAEALEIMEGLIQEYPNDYFIKNNAAWIYATATDLRIRDGARAIELSQDALLLQPGSFNVWSTLSEAYYISAEYERAQRAAEQALRLGIEREAPDENLLAYQNQVIKCRRATEALSLIE